MNWIKVNDDDPATLPPMEEVVWIVFPSGYDGGPVVQLGGRGSVDDGDRYYWTWGTLDTAYFARSWEKKLYDFEEDDIKVTHWAKIEWPDSYEATGRSAD